MSEHPAPEPVKLFVAALFSDAERLAAAIESVSSAWGAIDFQGVDHAFDCTDYYAEEMGDSLRRRLISFAAAVSPEALPDAKIRAIEIEEELAVDGRRSVNLDVGYLDHHKIVLASTKAAGQKIWLRDGVWADLQGRYAKGRYRPFDWTFPDFATGRYDDELGEIRKLHLACR